MMSRFWILVLVAVLAGALGGAASAKWLAGKGAAPRNVRPPLESAVPSTPPACVGEPGFLPPKDGGLLYNLRRLPNDEEIAANVNQALRWFDTAELFYAKGQPERASWWAAGASAAMLRVMLCGGGAK